MSGTSRIEGENDREAWKIFGVRGLSANLDDSESEITKKTCVRLEAVNGWVGSSECHLSQLHRSSHPSPSQRKKRIELTIRQSLLDFCLRSSGFFVVCVCRGRRSNVLSHVKAYKLVWSSRRSLSACWNFKSCCGCLNLMTFFTLVGFFHLLGCLWLCAQARFRPIS